MKRMTVLLTLILAAGICFNTQAANNPAGPSDGEKIFIENADKSLEIIAKAAKEISIEGAGIIAYIPGDVSKSWVSKMKVMGRLANDDANFCAIAYAKASEMAVTLKDSGNGDRKDITGEFGWPGGVILKVKSGYILAAFSGGTGEQDVEVAKKGLDWLAEQY